MVSLNVRITVVPSNDVAGASAFAHANTKTYLRVVRVAMLFGRGTWATDRSAIDEYIHRAKKIYMQT